MKKLFLIDAYALIFRSYYAFIGRPMRNSAGMNTSAVFGFVKFLREMIKRENPHYLGVAFDPKGGNFRHSLYPQYKANREETPEDILTAVPYIKRILEAMRIPILEIPGYEADDVIGTLAMKAAHEDFEVFMVTPDKDFGQLIRPHIRVYKQRKGGEGVDVIGCGEIQDNYGIGDPAQVIDILALWGDASDNIPGVPGIGEKSAAKLVSEFGTVENLLEHTDRLKGKQRESIEAHRDQILLAKQLATIKLDVPVAFEPNKLVMETPDIEMLAEVYQELGFRSFLMEMQGANKFMTAAGVPVGVNGGLSGSVSGGSSPRKHKDEQPAAGKGTAGSGHTSGKTHATTQGDLFSSVATHHTVSQQGLFAQGGAENADAAAGDGPDTGSASQDTLFEHSHHYEDIDTVKHTYHIVRKPDQLSALVAKLKAAPAFCFDTETTGFDIFADRLVGISFAIEPFEAWYVPCDKNNTEEVIRALKPVFESKKIDKIGQNIKFDLMVMRQAGVEVRGRLYDTMIIHYLLNPEARHGMDYLARTYLNYSPVSIESLIGKGARQITMDMVPVEKVAAYAAEDADVTLRLFRALWPMLEEAGQVELYSRIEEPLIEVLADIEMAGVKIDAEGLAQSGEVLRADLAYLEEHIRQEAKDPSLNVNSAKQLGEALFGRMKIDPKPKMTKTKQYSTDEDYLQTLCDKHPVVGKILEYRGLRKLLSTYIEALPQLINPVTGKIHTSFNQTVTATGRLSSTNPNLQNIPIRDERGREIRKAFIPSDKDRLLLSADYSQIELRLMAHLSDDPVMIEAFSKGEDIHTATAARLFKIPEAEVTREQRRRAKTANFGIIYGISAFGLAQRLNIPRAEAKQIIEGYFVTYTGVKRYMENVVEQAREEGYVTTLFGRKRMLPDIKSHNAVVRGLAERNAVNAPIQGGAADIMKLAMIAVHRELKERDLKSRIILQVHDELVIDLLRTEEKEVRKLVVRCMEEAAKLRVALIADCGVGENWLEAH